MTTPTADENDPFKKAFDVENEARKTVDESWDSPFHTLGKGATQAAPGNHKHTAAEITNLPAGLALSDALPKQESGSGSAGGGTKAARDDHVHPAGPGGLTVGNTPPPADGGGGSAGSTNVAARSDHQHPAHDVNYANSAGNADTVDGLHASAFASAGHGHDYAASGHGHGEYAGHQTIMEVQQHDFGNMAATTTASRTGSRRPDQVVVAVYSVYNAVNYTWGIGYPNANQYTVYLRNQSSSSNNVGIVYAILGTQAI